MSTISCNIGQVNENTDYNVQFPVFLTQDGCYFNSDTQEWEVIIDFEVVAWASSQDEACKIYHEMLWVEFE